ncbi:MAG: carboxypeptidase-like regulatory domain-containing protein [Cyclobacteriaceae bacterium]
MKKQMKYYALFGSFVLLSAFTLLVQEKQVSGQVSSGGEALPGVDVSVQNSNAGTVTNMKGQYSISVGDDADTLVFSSLGYETQKVAIGGKESINVQLQESE